MFLFILLIFAYLCGFFFVLGLIPIDWENRPRLLIVELDPRFQKRQERFLGILKKLSIINRPLCKGAFRERMARDLAISHVNMSPEEFLVIKEFGVIFALLIFLPQLTPDMVFGWLALSFAGGYWIPEIWLKSRIKKIKGIIVKELPDAIDLLGLCVNAGLDFMLALKWVVEKSPPSVMIEELNMLLQEINVGKTRREAIKSLAKRYELPDLSTFSRTLIQADKMGTSVTEALNILSEDMRLARYRRGEQLALKAPLKMLVPLLVFIFPVVGILVAGPIMLDFIENNPFKALTGGN